MRSHSQRITDLERKLESVTALLGGLVDLPEDLRRGRAAVTNASERSATALLKAADRELDSTKRFDLLEAALDSVLPNTEGTGDSELLDPLKTARLLCAEARAWLPERFRVSVDGPDAPLPNNVIPFPR